MVYSNFSLLSSDFLHIKAVKVSFYKSKLFQRSKPFMAHCEPVSIFRIIEIVPFNLVFEIA